MFRKTIPGMDRVFHSEPPEGSVILIVGSAGTLKSAFAYNLIANHLNNNGNSLSQAIYVTLEETRESLLSNIKNIGIPPTERIQISDIASFMREMESWSDYVTTEKDYIELILEKASRPFEIFDKFGLDPSSVDTMCEDGNPGKGEATLRPTIFVLDSLNALNSLVYTDVENIRKEMNSFMYRLRKKGITTIMIMEVDDAARHQPEHFLVDGIIELGIKELKNNRYKRYLRVHKMRSTNHSIEPFMMEVNGGGINIIEEMI